MPIFPDNFVANSLSGTILIIDGHANLSLTTNPYALEGDKSFVIKLRKGGTNGLVIASSLPITLRDTSSIVSLTANISSVNEGNLVQFTLVTANAVDNSNVYYSVFPATANITTQDFFGANIGKATIVSNQATFALRANADLSLVDETGENFRVQLRTNSPVGNIIYATSNVTILDVSKSINVYKFTESSATVGEGTAITFTVNASNFDVGTVIHYSTDGNATTSTFAGGNTGSFVMNTGSNTFTLTPTTISYNTTQNFNVVLRASSNTGAVIATSNNIVALDGAIPLITATGGTIVDSGGYRVHTFTTSNVFDVVSTVGTQNIEYLSVAGGGGAGRDSGGGGGAGGYLASTGTITGGNPLIITIGGGGNGQTSNPIPATNGNNTTIGVNITAVGGGAGGGWGVNNGYNGGSGGGGQGGGGGAGTAYPGQGNNGGTGGGARGGGGGGAGGAGSPTPGSTGGPGGVGAQSSITGTAVYYAGGGGGGGHFSPGGAGGLGGGGEGGISGTGNVNTGGGGGGSPSSAGNGAGGGSGIVIIRYPLPLSPNVTSITATSNVFLFGSNITFTVNAQNANLTTLYYTTDGNVIASNFINGNTGSFVANASGGIVTLQSNSSVTILKEFRLQIRQDSTTGFISGSSANVILINSADYYMQATGGNISIANGYKTHTFTVSGNLNVTGLGFTSSASNAEILVVAGGGGGGIGAGGGGGGGLLYGNINLSLQNYTVIIGGGGSTDPAGVIPGLGPSAYGLRGGNTTLSPSIVAIGGGGGAGQYGGLFQSGGSGAGGSASFGTHSVAGLQGPSGGLTGYKGNGAGSNPAAGGGGGGGGAGGNGASAPPINGYAQPGAGGAGFSTSISGSPVVYSAGGRGMLFNTDPGSPSRGNPSPVSSISPLAQNIGAGGTAGGNDSQPGSPGIVIIRYPYS